MISLGGKKRLGKRIVSDIYARLEQDDIYPVDCCWWEPFVGGGNVIEHVQGVAFGTDANSLIIDALIAIRDNPESLPKDNTEYTEQDYKDRKPSPLAPIAYSVGGKMWCGWKRGDGRDYVAEAYRSAKKQSPKFRYKRFLCGDYTEFDFGANMIIYCDPPYQCTTKYKHDIDHDEFFDWCRVQAKDNHVFVSEYSAPDDFELVAEYSHNTTFSGKPKKTVERLFRVF